MVHFQPMTSKKQNTLILKYAFNLKEKTITENHLCIWTLHTYYCVENKAVQTHSMTADKTITWISKVPYALLWYKVTCKCC